jgi:hypothetical protein
MPPERLAIAVPEGKPCVSLRIRLPDRTITAEIAWKSLCKRKRRSDRAVEVGLRRRIQNAHDQNHGDSDGAYGDRPEHAKGTLSPCVLRPIDRHAPTTKGSRHGSQNAAADPTADEAAT